MLTQEQINAFRKALYSDHAQFDHPLYQNIIKQEEAALHALLSGNYSLWLEIHYFDIVKRSSRIEFIRVPSLDDLRPLTQQYHQGELIAVLNDCHPNDAYDWDSAYGEVTDIHKRAREDHHVHCIGLFDRYGCYAGDLLHVLLPRLEDAPQSFIEALYERAQAAEEAGGINDEDKADENDITVRMSRKMCENLYGNKAETDEDDGIDPIHRLN